MVDNDLGPEGFGTRGIPSARRGYDKRVVDNLVAEAVERWGELKTLYDELQAAVAERGGLENLKRDLSAIGDEVSTILTAAGEAADGLRARAKEEADQRTDKSTAEAERVLGEADEQAFELRKDAWETGTELLELARETAAAIIQEAEAESLLVRADAEKESHRRLAVARKEMDDLVRQARYELDRQIAQARDLANEMLSTAEPTGETPIVEGPSLTERRRQLLGEIERIRAAKAIEDVAVLPAEPAPLPNDDELLFGELDPQAPGLSESLAAEVERLTNGSPNGGATLPSSDDRGSGGDDVGTLFEALRTTSDDPIEEPSDPVSLRDRFVLPAHNVGVREMKRRIVDLQTIAVEGLEEDPPWEPEAAAVARQLAPALETAVKRSAAGGVEAARILAGVAGREPSHGERTRRLVATMARDLTDQLVAVLAAADGDAAAAVVTVFREWRTDRAERWVRAIVVAAYHDELLGALAGVTSVQGIVVGTPCAECPAGAGTVWEPTEGLPEGQRVPPAHLDCACVLAPA